jgi:competence ComEA-like helix-hairpin-helix protein
VKFRFLQIIIFIFVLAGCGQGLEQDEITETKPESEQTVQVEEDIEETDKSDEAEKSDKEEMIENEQKTADTSADNLQELEVHYIDAGQGDATLFLYSDESDSYTILYDTGDWKRNDVVNYLNLQDITYIDLLIGSHPDADHIGQMAEIISSFEVGEVWMSGNESSSQTFQLTIEAILSSNADYHEPRSGEEFAIGPMDIAILHPENISGKSNEESIALNFSYGNHDFIFTGDAGKPEELQMLRRAEDVSATILRLGHHGSNTSSDPAFIEAVNPAAAIYSAGDDNSYGHPHAEVLTLIQDAGIDLYGTDTHGTIVVTTDGKSYSIETNKEGTISPESTSSSGDSDQTTDQNSDDTQSEEIAGCVNINTASMEEVQEIIHIGPKRAEDLIGLRPYNGVEDLDKINGIGPARLDDIMSQDLACVEVD